MTSPGRYRLSRAAAAPLTLLSLKHLNSCSIAISHWVGFPFDTVYFLPFSSNLFAAPATRW